jgi:hypothetical protein
MKALTALRKARRDLDRERHALLKDLHRVDQLLAPINREIAILETMAEQRTSRKS